jgi:hypothetical protein
MLAFEESFLKKTPFLNFGVSLQYLIGFNRWSNMCAIFEIFIHIIKPTFSWDLMKF